MVTLDVSKVFPGVVVYDFLPTKEALETIAIGAAAYAVLRIGEVAAARIAATGMVQTGARAAGIWLTEGSMGTMAYARF